MPREHAAIDTVREIRIDPRPKGLRAVYLAEPRRPEEAREIEGLFVELESRLQVRLLCRGKLLGYVVQAHESDSELLDELEDVLKAASAFVVTQRACDELTWRIVRDLCRATGSRLIPLPRCNICGVEEPFPATEVGLTDGNGSAVIHRSYCANCTAQTPVSSNKELVRSLLAADERGFGSLERARCVRRRSARTPAAPSESRKQARMQ